MIVNEHLALPRSHRRTAEFIRYAEHFWVGALFTTVGEAHEQLSHYYHEPVDQLRRLVDSYFPRREVPRSAEDCNLSTLLNTKTGSEAYGLFFRFFEHQLKSTAQEDIRNRVYYLRGPSPYLIGVFDEPGEVLSEYDIAKRLRDRFHVRMDGGLDFLANGLVWRSAPNPDPPLVIAGVVGNFRLTGKYRQMLAVLSVAPRPSGTR